MIPSAGRGTRLFPATLAVPKELLPIGGVPMIQRTLEEAAASGIREVAIILARGKEAIRRHLETAAPGPALRALRALRRRLRITWIEQHPVAGLGDALWSARAFCRDEPFAVLLPDNVIEAPTPALLQLADAFHDRPADHALATVVTPAEAHRFSASGRIEYEGADERTVRITRFLPKARGDFPVPDGVPRLRTVGRWILTPRFFRHAEAARRRLVRGREFDDVPVLRAMAREGEFYARLLLGTVFDAGNPRGLQRASFYVTDWNTSLYRVGEDRRQDGGGPSLSGRGHRRQEGGGHAGVP
ncbi:MAG: NTP transferase domain-containing protein [Planctomycetes bacterium]|nr:NTP transferase domain-containing protein [Planctomycetota bacterium]